MKIKPAFPIAVRNMSDPSLRVHVKMQLRVERAESMDDNVTEQEEHGDEQNEQSSRLELRESRA